MKEKLLSSLKYLIFIGMGAGLLYLAFYKQDMAKLMEEIRNADLRWIYLASVFGTLAHLSRAVRWKMLINSLGYKPALKSSIFGVMIGYLVNYAVPRLGEVTRCAVVHKLEKIPMDKLVGTVLVERIFDMLTFMIICIVSFFYQYDLLSDFFSREIYPGLALATGKLSILLLVMAVSFVGFILFFLFIRKRVMHSTWYLKLLDLLKGFMAGLKTITQLERPWLFIAHTIFMWAMYYMMTFLCFFAIESTSHLGLNAGLTILVVGAIAVIIPAPGGIGSFHKLVPLGLMLYGVSESHGLVFATIAHASQMLLMFFLGAVSLVFFQVYIFRNRDKKKKPGNE